MNRAVSSFCRIDLPLDQALPLLHGEAPCTIELFCEAPHLDTNGDWRSQIKWLRQYAQTHGLTYALHAPCFDLNPASANAGVRAEVVRQYQVALSIAEALDARQMVVHSGPRSDPRLSVAQAREYVRAMLETLVPLAETNRVRLALENTGYGEASIITAPDDLLTLIADLPQQTVGLTLDLGHAVLQGIELGDAITAWMPRLVNVHLHDNRGISDEHLPPGAGIVPLGKALAVLASLKYTGSVVLESFLGGPRPISISDAWAGVIPVVDE